MRRKLLVHVNLSLKKLVVFEKYLFVYLDFQFMLEIYAVEKAEELSLGRVRDRDWEGVELVKSSRMHELECLQLF
jgi:hypothetical protein